MCISSRPTILDSSTIVKQCLLRWQACWSFRLELTRTSLFGCAAIQSFVFRSRSDAQSFAVVIDWLRSCITRLPPRWTNFLWTTMSAFARGGGHCMPSVRLKRMVRSRSGLGAAAAGWTSMSSRHSPASCCPVQASMCSGRLHLYVNLTPTSADGWNGSANLA